MNILFLDKNQEYIQNITKYFSNHNIVFFNKSFLQNPAKTFDIDIIICDVDENNKEYLSFCENIHSRDFYIPIVYTSAQFPDGFIKNKFQSGLTDFLKKPYSEPELEQRVKALLNINNLSEKIFFKGMYFDFETNTLFDARKKEEIYLTKKQRQILFLLLKNIDSVVTYDSFRYFIWGESQIAENVIALHIKNLRKVLPNDCIENYSSIGYKFLTDKGDLKITQISDSISIPDVLRDEWRELTIHIAKYSNSKIAIINKIEDNEIITFCSNSSAYPENERHSLEKDSLCSFVVQSQNFYEIIKLEDKQKWKETNEVKKGFKYYLSSPIFWPNKKLFGTVCILIKDEKNENKDLNDNRSKNENENKDLKKDKDLKNSKDILRFFTKSIEKDLFLLSENQNSKYLMEISHVENTKNLLKDANSKISRYLNLIDENIIYSTCDMTGNITHISKAFSQSLGYKKIDLIGQSSISIFYPQNNSSILGDIIENISKGSIWSKEVKNICKDGLLKWYKLDINPIIDEKGLILGYEEIRIDITDTKRLSELSIKDEITGLYNLNYFSHIYDLETRRSFREKKDLVLGIVSIDNFKKYSDYLGYKKSQRLLVEVATILSQQFARANDYLFRISQDEFAILYRPSDEKDFLPLERAKGAVLKKSIFHPSNKNNKVSTISIGATYIYGSKNSPKEEAQKLANNALAKAKISDKNEIIVHFLKD